MKVRSKKVFVGVSGGVDSSVSLALLKDAGYEVTGVFIRTWQPDFIECTWRDERRDAMRVCAHLQVPFLECDLEQVYKDEVGMYMINEYKKGRTPNPDVMCNKKVKFGGFLDFAIKHGADYIATGHYAQIKNNNEIYFLKKSKDESKDQTYFLWTLTQEQLSKVLFPIGHLLKSEVRKIAKRYALPTALKKDSQGVCFLGMIDMKEFLSHYIKKEQGPVLNIKNEVIGTHDGAVFITIGQRHGFMINKKGKTETPYYVVSKKIEDNTITVTNDLIEASNKIEHEIKKLFLKDVVFNGSVQPDKKYTARIRYRQNLEFCSLKIDHNSTRFTVLFDNPQISVSKGQSCVIYDGDLCLGGGVID